MIGDAAVLVAARDAGLDDVLERLASVAPRGVHLQIAAIVGERRSVSDVLRERREHLCTTQEVSRGVRARRAMSCACRSRRRARSTVATIRSAVPRG